MKENNVDRIKDLLNVWAHYYTADSKPCPDPEIQKFNSIIEDRLDSTQIKVISTEYGDRAPQKAKYKLTGLGFSAYGHELAIIYRSLSEKLYGKVST